MFVVTFQLSKYMNTTKECHHLKCPLLNSVIKKFLRLVYNIHIFSYCTAFENASSILSFIMKIDRTEINLTI